MSDGSLYRLKIGELMVFTGSVLSVKEESADDGGACELKFDENTGQLIRSCE